MTPWRSATLILALALSACSAGAPVPAEKPVQGGPPAMDVVRVVERPVSVTLSMPAELEPY